MNKLLEGYTTAMNQTVEQLRESFSEEQLDFFKHRASMNKALDLLWGQRQGDRRGRRRQVRSRG